MIRRPAEQVARRAVIHGTIAFRGSLEVTDHPRCAGLSQQLLPWLTNSGCAQELDPIELDLLSTPLGHLGESLWMDVKCAGQAAAFFCWTLKLLGTPGVAQRADESQLPGILCILRPEVTQLIRSASLRASQEIEDACRQVVLIRSMLQESRVTPPASDIVRRMHLEKLNEAGLAVAEADVQRAAMPVAAMTPQERAEAAGLCFVRDHAAMWLFSDRSNYFEADDE